MAGERTAATCLVSPRPPRFAESDLHSATTSPIVSTVDRPGRTHDEGGVVVLVVVGGVYKEAYPNSHRRTSGGEQERPRSSRPPRRAGTCCVSAGFPLAAACRVHASLPGQSERQKRIGSEVLQVFRVRLPARLETRTTRLAVAVPVPRRQRRSCVPPVLSPAPENISLSALPCYCSGRSVTNEP